MKNVTVPAPIALPGERVIVKNYRRKYDQWEPGVVYDTEANWYNAERAEESGRPCSYSYRVRLDRMAPQKHNRSYRDPLFVHVGDDGIKPE